MTIHRPDISFVTSVYNKADILPFAIGALARQSLSASVEYIFIEDCSADHSLSVLRDQAERLERVSILTNERNLGPAFSVNRGARAAKGRYLCLIDSDELIVPDAVETMFSLLSEHDAQIAHGREVKTTQPAHQITLAPLNKDFTYEILDNPFLDVLRRRGAERIGRMAWLVEKDLFNRANGCDMRLFIQDESLRLRLTCQARRLINFKSPMMYAPPVRYQVSKNKHQQHHDQFFNCYHFLHENADISQSAREILARQCISMAWKATRYGVLGAAPLHVFLRYIGAKTRLLKPQNDILEYFADFFNKITGIRRQDMDYINKYFEN